MMTFQSSLVDIFMFSLLWTGVYLSSSFSHRKYDQPPSITAEPRPAYCSKPFCDKGDTVTIYFKELETIRIRCVSSGRPEVSYKWRKDNVDFDISSSRISLEPGIGTLIITNATQLDQGLYQCSATNKKGTALSKKAKVIFAINGAFKSVTTPESQNVYEGWPTSLKCTQPFVVPTPSVYWTYVGKDVEDPLQARVKLDERVAIDYDGTLHFANIKLSDVTEDGKFICNMHNFIYRTYSEGEDKIVRVISNKRVSPVSTMWRSKQNVKGLKGEEAKFMCIFAGKQTPTIKWNRIIGRQKKPIEDLEDAHRMKVSDSGHELIISGLEFKDSGEYQCSATNDITTDPVIEDFQLQVQARPYWVNRAPSDVTIGVEENAEFECLVDGSPQPNVEWFINTKPIAEVPNPRRTLQKHRLVFKNVSDTDSQVIQCKTTNTHGALLADVYLNVLALTPEITKGPGQIKVAEDNSVTLTCENNGKPDPRLRWKKGSQHLDTQRFEFSHNSITIKNVTSTDEGIYSCIAKNRYGEDESTGKLTVRKKTTVKLRPAERKLRYGRRATFSCSVTTDHNELPFLVTTWFKDEEPVDINDRNIEISEKGDMLTIIKASSKDSANYTCHADNKVDKATAVSQLKVEAPPEPPMDVMFKTCGKLKATLRWTPGFDNYLKINYFIIYSKTFYVDKFRKMTQTTSGDITEVELRLSPYANYTFKVSAVNQLGESVPSNVTNICETKAALPAYNPKGVKIVENKKGKLVIEWDAIPPIDQNGPDFRYMIYVRRKADSKKKAYEIKEWQDTRKEIDVGFVYEEYSIEVVAENRKGKATGNSIAYSGHSGMGEPKVVPANFERDEDAPFTHETVGFKWDPVDTSAEAMQGKFNGYKIRYWNVNEPEKIKELEIPPQTAGKRRRRQTDNKVRATARLPPYTALQLEVVARNTYYDSNGSNVINMTTKEGVPGKVEELDAKQKGGNFMVLEWKLPKVANGEIQGYDVAYEKIKGLNLDKDIYEVTEYRPTWVENHQMYTIRVTGLELRTKYRFYVWARTSVGRGDKNYVDAVTAAGSKPTIPYIEDVIPGKTFFKVTWNIRKNDTAGLNYYVQYKRIEDPDYISGPYESRNNWQIIRNLTSGQAYKIRVVAESGKFKSPSSPKLISTLGTAAVASAVYEATWFIIMMVVLALLLLVLIIVCLVKRSRGDKYHVQEKEKLRGLDNDEKKTAQYNGFNDNGETQPLAGSPDDYDRGPLESDKDSLEEYGDPDPTRFNEDGSFIGQYGAEKMTASEVAVPSAMHTFV